MNDWQTITWGDAATLQYGKTLRDYKGASGDFPVYGTNGPIGFTERSLCEHAGVIIGRKGAYRGVHYSDRPFFVIDTAFYLQPREGVELDLRFAYYQLLTKNINSMDSGSAIPSTSREDFYTLDLDLPPIAEQIEIASILTAIDEKIELNRKQNRTLETIAQALFKHWFVDFEFPDENGNPYKSSGGAMQPSELGEIPVGWKSGTLRDVAQCFDYKRVPLSSRERAQRQGFFPYYGATSIMDYVDDFLFDGTYLLMGEDGSVITETGHPYLQYVWGKIWVNNHAHILQGKGCYSTEMLYILLKHSDISHLVTGAVQLKLTRIIHKKGEPCLTH